MDKRALGLFSLTCLGLNCVIGSGIFTEPGKIAQSMGPWAPLGFALGGLVCLPIGICFAEMARGETETGGSYLYARRAFGPEVGFLVGWVIWLSGLIGGATVAVGFGQILGSQLKLPGYENLFGCILLTLLALINLSGTRKGALSNDFLAVTKLLPLIGFVVWSLYEVGPSKMFYPPPSPNWNPGFLIGGILPILYTFSGFEEVPLPAGDVRDAEKTVPRAVILVLAISTVFYALIQGGVSGLGLAGDPAPLSSATEGVAGLGRAVNFGSILCLLSVNASIAFTAPRSLWALANGRWLPQWLCYVDPRRSVPSLCILVNLAMALALAASGSFDKLVEMSVLAALAQHLVTSLACWKGRNSRLRPSMPMLATLICFGLLYTCSWQNIKGLLELMLSGWVISLLYRKICRPDR